MEHLHQGKASPLHAKLCDTQQSCSALKMVQLLTTLHRLPRLGYCQDVGEPRSSRCRAQKHEIGRDTLCCTPRDNAIMLRKIRDQHSDQDQATRNSMSAKLC